MSLMRIHLTKALQIGRAYLWLSYLGLTYLSPKVPKVPKVWRDVIP